MEEQRDVTLRGAIVEEHGFDPQQLLPHFVPFWFAAQASLLSLLALDVLAIVAWRRRWRWQKLQTAVNDSSEPVIQVDQQWISAAPRSESDRIGNPEPSMR